jgi:hypothetical protein
MGLGDWIKGKRDELKQNAIQMAVDRGLASLDAWGAKKWPVGWIRVRRMGVGWKTLLGAVLFYAPDIMAGADKYAPGIASALGMDDKAAEGAVKAVGTVLFFIGAADKYLKFTKPIERRQGERYVRSESGQYFAISPTSAVPTVPSLPVPPMTTPEARVVFDNVLTAETKKGEPLEVAQTSALEAVAKVNPK